MLEKLAKSIEEVNVLAEHYRTCQNVAAIESLAKECFISKEDTDAFIAGKRKFLLKVLLEDHAGNPVKPCCYGYWGNPEDGCQSFIGRISVGRAAE